MNKSLVSLAAAAAFLIVATPGPKVEAAAATTVPMIKADASEVIQVRERGRSFHRFHRHRRVHRHFYRHRHRHYHHRRWRGPRFSVFIGPPRCGWLRRRAIITGSHYWWRRYRRCLAWW